MQQVAAAAHYESARRSVGSTNYPQHKEDAAMASNGWSELGALLGGGNQLQEMQARQAGLLAGMRQASMLEDARKKRDAAMGLEQITPQAIQNVMSPVDPVTGQPYMPEVRAQFQGDLVSAMLRAHQDPRQVSGYLKDQQGIDWGNQAMAAATGEHPDLNLVNRINMVRSGKPEVLTSVDGGTLIDRMVTPDQQAAQGGNAPTQLSLADMAIKAAQANEHNARARLLDSQAEAGGGSRKAGGWSKPTLPPLGALGATLGQGYDKDTGLVTIPPDKMQHFLTWQASKAEQDPRYNNGAFALQHYASEAPLGTGVHDTPADVGATSLTEMMGGAPRALAPATSRAPVTVPAPTAAPVTASSNQPARPSSQAEFDALPRGALFINPADGRLMRKK